MINENTLGIIKGSRFSINELKVEIQVDEKDLNAANLIYDHINAHKPFALGCPESIVIFIPGLLIALWVGIEKANMKYDSIKAFENGVKLQYISHKEFIDISHIIGKTFTTDRNGGLKKIGL